VELENVSAEAIEIEHSLHPLEYLNLAITDEAGQPVPVPPYGWIFSPHGSVHVLRLASGEKYTHVVALLGHDPEERHRPGTYTVRAIYEYKELRAVSEPLQVVIPEQEANGEPA
jgi:hypothetical protein